MNHDEIRKIAHMARIQITDDEIEKYEDIGDILELAKEIADIDTANIEPMSHPLLNMSQRLRKDEVTEPDQRKQLQAISPSETEAGLYLVPGVFEE